MLRAIERGVGIDHLLATSEGIIDYLLTGVVTWLYIIGVSNGNLMVI